MRVWIEHPELPGRRVQVADQAVPHYRASGWVVTDAPPKPKKLPDDEKSPAAKRTPAAGEAPSENKTENEPESPKPRRRTTKED
ncbi:hypothetical protein [Streptomyces sp. NPDC020983]|uniref:hypothetical protein n=1 Tax=Streptomyces sp. NPDC020983 TaxID=3365106 RepID=UPI0037BD9CDD